MSDDCQSGWRKVYKSYWEDTVRPLLPYEVARLTVPQFLLVMNDTPTVL